MLSPEVQKRTPLKDRARNLVKSFGEALTRPDMSRDELLKGISVFEDPQTLQVMAYVQRDLSVSSWQVLIKMALNEHRPFDPSVNEASIESRLSTLFDNGFVNKLEPDNPAAFTLYSPTTKGVKVMKVLNTI